MGCYRANIDSKSCHFISPEYQGASGRASKYLTQQIQIAQSGKGCKFVFKLLHSKIAKLMGRFSKNHHC
uniref:Secreted protein n=1 Tax=Parascaris univalens TaxID=6257 RepID=A0A915CAW8_PARUN